MDAPLSTLDLTAFLPLVPRVMISGETNNPKALRRVCWTRTLKKMFDAGLLPRLFFLGEDRKKGQPIMSL